MPGRQLGLKEGVRYRLVRVDLQGASAYAVVVVVVVVVGPAAVAADVV